MTTLRPDEYVDKRGRVRRRVGPVPRCHCCGGAATVEMEIGRYRDDWAILTCDGCIEDVCLECSDVDDDGRVTCIDCLQTPTERANAWKRHGTGRLN